MANILLDCLDYNNGSKFRPNFTRLPDTLKWTSAAPYTGPSTSVFCIELAGIESFVVTYYGTNQNVVIVDGETGTVRDIDYGDGINDIFGITGATGWYTVSGDKFIVDIYSNQPEGGEWHLNSYYIIYDIPDGTVTGSGQLNIFEEADHGYYTIGDFSPQFTWTITDDNLDTMEGYGTWYRSLLDSTGNPYSPYGYLPIKEIYNTLKFSYSGVTSTRSEEALTSVFVGTSASPCLTPYPYRLFVYQYTNEDLLEESEMFTGLAMLKNADGKPQSMGLNYQTNHANYIGVIDSAYITMSNGTIRLFMIYSTVVDIPGGHAYTYHIGEFTPTAPWTLIQKYDAVTQPIRIVGYTKTITTSECAVLLYSEGGYIKSYSFDSDDPSINWSSTHYTGVIYSIHGVTNKAVYVTETDGSVNHITYYSLSGTYLGELEQSNSLVVFGKEYIYTVASSTYKCYEEPHSGTFWLESSDPFDGENIDKEVNHTILMTFNKTLDPSSAIWDSSMRVDVSASVDSLLWIGPIEWNEVSQDGVNYTIQATIPFPCPGVVRVTLTTDLVDTVNPHEHLEEETIFYFFLSGGGDDDMGDASCDGATLTGIEYGTLRYYPLICSKYTRGYFHESRA